MEGRKEGVGWAGVLSLTHLKPKSLLCLCRPERIKEMDGAGGGMEGGYFKGGLFSFPFDDSKARRGGCSGAEDKGSQPSLKNSLYHVLHPHGYVVRGM